MEQSKQTKVISFKYQHTENAEIAAVQIFVERGFVTVVYLNERGSIVDADVFDMTNNPELKEIVTKEIFDDVWNFDLVMALVEPVDANEPACDAQWRFVQWQPTTPQDFYNQPASIQVAS